MSFRASTNVLIIYLCALIVAAYGFSKQLPSSSSSCQPPRGCQFKTFHYLNNLGAFAIYSSNDSRAIRCDVRDTNFSFTDSISEWFRTWREQCRRVNDHNRTSSISSYSPYLDIRFEATKTGGQVVLNRNFGLQSLVNYLLAHSTEFVMRFTDLRQIELDLAIEFPNPADYPTRYGYFRIELVNSRLDYLVNGRPVESCRDMLSNLTGPPRGIFQLFSIEMNTNFFLFNTRSVRPLCPLVFASMRAVTIAFHGLADTFYKHNMIAFSNETGVFDTTNTTTTTTTPEDQLDSDVYRVIFFKNENVALDRRLLHPLVFHRLELIYSYGHVRHIDEGLFAALRNVKYLYLDGDYFRKLAHTQPIVAWTRPINRDLKLNMNDVDSVRRHFARRFQIIIRVLNARRRRSIERLFPARDFCLYKEFPFEQLVTITFELDVWTFAKIQLDDYNPALVNSLHSTCTFLWLIQYHITVSHHFWNTTSHNSTLLLLLLLLKRCDFRRLIDLCNTSRFAVRATPIWDNSDWHELSKRSLAFFTVSGHVISLLGLATNSLVCAIVWHRTNRLGVFKTFKHYPYLSAISVCNLLILSIQMIAWLADCLEIGLHDTFCPRTHKLVAVQFFKLVVKEGLVAALRLMSNFLYVAFAFNRIALIIGQQQQQKQQHNKKNTSVNKLIEYVSKKSLRKFVSVTFLISCCLAVVKGFKYRINYDHAEREYPLSNEDDQAKSHSWLRDVYLGSSLAFDLVNYLVFVWVNMAIDVYMVVRFRRTVDEKLARLASMIAHDSAFAVKAVFDHLETKKSQHIRESLKNDIKMVVINATLNVLFKLPLSLRPIYNVIATVYYQSSAFKVHRSMDVFFMTVQETGLLESIPSFADWLYTLLISIQLFIYVRFDINMRKGLKKILGMSY